MTIEKIVEFQKKSAEVLAEMVSELSEEDIKKLRCKASSTKGLYLTHFEIEVTKFTGKQNSVLLGTEAGLFGAKGRAAYNKHLSDCSDAKWGKR